MKTKQQLYNHLATNLGIFLPPTKLNEVWEKFQTEIKTSMFRAIYKLENDKSLKKYSDKYRGAFVPDMSEHLEWAKISSKKVAQIDVNTDKVIAIHNSLYAASKAIGVGKNYCGNISKVCQGKANKACGFKWKFIF